MSTAPGGGLAEGHGGDNTLSFLFMVISHVVKLNLFALRSMRKRLSWTFSFQAPEQGMFLFHGFGSWISFATQDRLCGRGHWAEGAPGARGVESAQAR